MKHLVTHRELFTEDRLHQDMLTLIERAYGAIDTEERLRELIRYDGTYLSIGATTYAMKVAYAVKVGAARSVLFRGKATIIKELNCLFTFKNFGGVFCHGCLNLAF